MWYVIVFFAGYLLGVATICMISYHRESQAERERNNQEQMDYLRGKK